MKNITLTLTTQMQVDSLMRALEMQHNIEDDIVLEDTVTTVNDVRMLSEKDDFEMMAMLRKRRNDTKDAINRLIATNSLIYLLQNELDKRDD
jgi:hypothetical protein